MSAFERPAEEAPARPAGDRGRELAVRQNGRDMVSAEIEQMLSRRGSAGLPDCIPRGVKAAAWWVIDTLLDPRADDEHVRKLSGERWATPYRDRVVYAARKFLRMAPGDQQAVADAVARSGLRYRGDDAAQFLELCR